MKIGSLCSGIGGLEKGLEDALGAETVFQVEQDPFCRRILGKHWPRARQHDDVHHVGKRNLPYVDLLCFGFPCQDISSAGTQSGLSGARSGLFYQCARVVEELAPEWVVVENVASGAKLWVDAATAELERLGYAVLPVPLSASDVGALHPRARVFLAAHLNGVGKRAQPGLPKVARASEASGTGEAAHADAQRRQAELSTEQRDARGFGEPEGNDRAEAVTDADSEQLRDEQQRDSRRGDGVQSEGEAEPCFPGWSEPEPDVVRMAHELPEALDSARVRALGNSVVVWCAEAVGWIIRELIEEIDRAE